MNVASSQLLNTDVTARPLPPPKICLKFKANTSNLAKVNAKY